MLLTKEQILQADDIQYRDVEVPEWGGTVRVRMMTGCERDTYELEIIGSRGKESDAMTNIRATLLAYTIVDDKCERLFTKADVVALGKKSVKALNRVFNVASSLNSLSNDDVKSLAKNSEADHKDGSTTA